MYTGQVCQRCGKKADSLIMSMFNTDMICGSCKSAERMDPAYKAAQEAERKAVLSGDYNFPGIGLPDSLKM